MPTANMSASTQQENARVAFSPDRMVVTREIPPRFTDKQIAKELQKAILPEIHSSDMVLDKSQPLPTSLQRDFLPDDILLALTQNAFPKDSLAPPTRYRNLSTTSGSVKKRPANVWSHPRKDRFKHLTENTACICGAGQDISFLYDVPKPKLKLGLDQADKFDPSSVRSEQDDQPRKQGFQLPDTLIPEEYHVVKNKGVMGIEYLEDKYALQPVDHEKHLVVFPSMKPTSRYEVLQLKKTLDNLLLKCGINDISNEISGPTQMHNLLELIKKEQNIYNIIFHELIRQVSIECSDRGELLAEVRARYSNLLNKVPHQIRSLHDEVLAQRALDRRLTEELMRFKSTITILTNELSDVTDHDITVTHEAHTAQDDLKLALLEAQRNSSLLTEYHDLYELQRYRLEQQVIALTEEKEIWSMAAYSLALKVAEENKLVSAKRMHISEKSWAKLAKHFTILLSDKDTEILTKVQGFVENWRDLVENFNLCVVKSEEEMRIELDKIRGSVLQWQTLFDNECYSEEGHFQKGFDGSKQADFLEKIKHWVQILTNQSDSFVGDSFLTSEEELAKIRKQMEGWTDSALKLFGRHKSNEGSSNLDLQDMLRLNEEVDKLINQYHIRLTGENGVAHGLLQLINLLEIWDTKITISLNGTSAMKESDWLRLRQQMEECLILAQDTIQLIGTTKHEKSEMEASSARSDAHETVTKVQKWLNGANNAIHTEDAKLVDQVASLHCDMVGWMVQVLLRLAPDREDTTPEASQMALLASAPVNQLEANVMTLFDKLTTFTIQVAGCCDGIVLESAQRRRDNMDEMADEEYNQLQQFKQECEEWKVTAQVILCQLTGQPYDEMVAKTLARTQQKKAVESGQAVVTESTALGRQSVDAAMAVSSNKLVSSPDQPSPRPQPTPDVTDGPADQVPVQDSPTVDKKEPAADHAQDGLDDNQQAAAETVPSEAHSESEVHEGAPPEVTPHDTVQVIGYDHNTYTNDLEQQATQPPPRPVSVVSRPVTPDTKQAFEALALLETLQLQLIETEERAQKAEERASLVEIELASCQEKLRGIEKQQATAEEAAKIAAATASEASSRKAGTKTPVSVDSGKAKTGEFKTTPPRSKGRPDSQSSSRPVSRASKSKKK